MKSFTDAELYLEAVKDQSPLNRLAYWISERESIRLRRAAKKPPPWTRDPILSAYRFCNVRRMDDKVSLWLLRNWYQLFHGHPNMLAAVALARFVNRPESLTRLTPFVFGPLREHRPVQWEEVKTTLRNFRDTGGTVFNGAYMVRGNTTKSPDKIGTVVDEYIGDLMAAYVAHPADYVYGNSMHLTHAAISTRYGFGSFMAGQIVADLRWAVPGDWGDRMTWAPIGPGSARGMNRLHSRPLKSPLPQEQFLVELRQLMTDLKPLVASETYDRLEAHDFQNCLCEYDKYERALWGEGKPKQGYAPGRGK